MGCSLKLRALPYRPGSDVPPRREDPVIADITRLTCLGFANCSSGFPIVRNALTHAPSGHIGALDAPSVRLPDGELDALLPAAMADTFERGI
jgi:hypothetical protein